MGRGQAELEEEADSPLSREPKMQGSFQGLWDHGLSRKQTLNQLSHPGAQITVFYKLFFSHLTKKKKGKRLNHTILQLFKGQKITKYSLQKTFSTQPLLGCQHISSLIFLCFFSLSLFFPHFYLT